MRQKKALFQNSIIILSILATLFGLAILIYEIPAVNERLAWRRERLLAYWRGVIHPADAMPTPVPQSTETISPVTSTPTLTATAVTPTVTKPGPTQTQTPSPTPLPPIVSLNAPAWEKQDINNCGPAALAMYLRYYGWGGDQFNISDMIKPVREDRNVNPEEMIYWVRNYAGWLNAEFRVGGDLELLKQLLAAGIPVMIEESFYFDAPYWPNDDLWAAHYFLVTGYNDETQSFTGQDSYHGPNQTVPYATLDEYWHIFNRVLVLVYMPAQEDSVKEILGPMWEMDASRQHAMAIAETEVAENPQDAFAWFNLGSNQVYFEQYAAAARSYDEARRIGLPQRMLRYQFGPFFAYFHAFRNEELLALAEYTLQLTPNAEEALLWHGWGLYREGDTLAAIEEWQKALEANPNFLDAQYALDYVRSNP